MNNLTKQLEWRYATKRMNGKAVPQEKVDAILEAIRLAPSSYGLTPYSIIVIKDKTLLKEVQKVAYMQPQITEGSHLLVFAVWEDITEKKVDGFMELVSKIRGVPVADLDGYKKMIWDNVSARSQTDNMAWSAKQAYIALGVGLTAAALENIDSTPMEGFDPAKLDQVLGLKTKGLRSVSLLMLGYRDPATDTLINAKKVRRAKEDLFIEM